MWRPDQDFVLPLSQGLHFSIVCYPFCYLAIPVGLGSSVSILSSLVAFAGSFPFETFLALNYCLTLVYNLINCHRWNARAGLFPCRFQIVHFSPTLSLHHKTRSSCFRLYFWSFFLEELMDHAPKHRRGESEWLRLRS